MAEIEYSENPRTVDGRTYRNFRWERGAPSGNGGPADPDQRDRSGRAQGDG